MRKSYQLTLLRNALNSMHAKCINMSGKVFIEEDDELLRRAVALCEASNDFLCHVERVIATRRDIRRNRNIPIKEKP